MGIIEKILKALEGVFSRSMRDKEERGKLLSEKFRLEQERAANRITDEKYSGKEAELHSKVICLDLENAIRERIEKAEELIKCHESEHVETQEIEDEVTAIKKELRENRLERNKSKGAGAENVNRLKEIYSRLTGIEIKAKNLGKENERQRRINTIMKETGVLLSNPEQHQKETGTENKQEEYFRGKAHLMMPRSEKIRYDITPRKNPKRTFLRNSV